MKQTKKYNAIREILLIFIGTGIMALGIKTILDPATIVNGGFSGIAIIVKEISKRFFQRGIPLWLTTFALNVPLFLAAWYFRGLSVIKKSIGATLLLSAWLYVIPEWKFVEGDLFLSALMGGIVCGTGIGMIFLANATTGGTDLLAMILQKWFPYLSIAQIMQVIDGIIVAVGAGVFGIHKACYALVAIYLVTKMADAIVEGPGQAKAVYIITTLPQQTKQQIYDRVNRGVTMVQAEGGYSGNEKTMLLCVVGRKEIVALKEAVKETDEKAFVIVTDAREVLGEGFL